MVVFGKPMSFNFLIYPFLILCLTACKKNSMDNLSQLDGNISEGSEYLWPNAQASVCWETDIKPEFYQKHAPTRKKVQDIVTSEYARAGFSFTGWGECQPGSRGIRVGQWLPETNLKSGGKVQAFGRRIDGLHHGLQMHMEFPRNRNSSLYVLVTALHEFGHAIGLRHEANRQDSNCHLDQLYGIGEDHYGALPLGEYDSESIMNYCANVTADLAGIPGKLSDGDIKIIRALYSGQIEQPRQAACQKDGHSWVAEAMFACCRLSPGKTPPLEINYPICPENLNTTEQVSKPSSPDTPPPLPPLEVNRLSLRRQVKVYVDPEIKASLAILHCKEGFYRGGKRSLDSENIFIQLIQAGGGVNPNFNCTHIEVFDQAIAANASEMKRFVFKQPVTIPILVNGPAYELNLQGAIWTSFNVKEGKVVEATGPKDSQQAAKNDLEPKLLGQKKVVSLGISNLPMNSHIQGAMLNCDIGKLFASNSGYQPQNNDSRLPIGMNFLLTEIQFNGKPQIICFGVDFGITLKTRSPSAQKTQTATSSESTSPSAQKAPTADTRFISLKFAQPLVIEANPLDLTRTFPAPNCALTQQIQNFPENHKLSTSPATDIKKSDDPLGSVKASGAPICGPGIACSNGWGWHKQGQFGCAAQTPGWLENKKGCSCQCGSDLE